MFGEVKYSIIPNGWWFMLASPAPADPGWDDDLAWLDRDPERDCWQDRAREHDDPPEPGEEEHEDHEDHYPLTAEDTGPKCRHDHRLKQHPKWKVGQLPDGTFRWTTPAGRTYTTEPTRYPI
jgi:hypothetical protein